jgi:hypothetical protein
MDPQMEAIVMLAAGAFGMVVWIGGAYLSYQLKSHLGWIDEPNQEAV